MRKSFPKWYRLWGLRGEAQGSNLPSETLFFWHEQNEAGLRYIAIKAGWRNAGEMRVQKLTGDTLSVRIAVTNVAGFSKVQLDLANCFDRMTDFLPQTRRESLCETLIIQQKITSVISASKIGLQ
jgi:hypothetical protein